MFHVNFPLDSGEELSVDFDVESGPNVPCHKCGKPGFQSLIEVSEVTCDGVLIERDSPIYWAAVAKLRKAALHKQGRCEPNTGCAEEFWEDLFAGLDEIEA